MMLVCFLYSVPKKLKASSAGHYLYEKFGVIRESGRTAERLYAGCGFQFVEAKQMFYENTKWTEYKMYELNL